MSQPPRHEARLELPCDDEDVAKAVMGALAVEEGPEGSATELRRRDRAVVAVIHAADASTLRAQLQATLRLFHAAVESARA